MSIPTGKGTRIGSPRGENRPKWRDINDPRGSEQSIQGSPWSYSGSVPRGWRGETSMRGRRKRNCQSEHKQNVKSSEALSVGG